MAKRRSKGNGKDSPGNLTGPTLAEKQACFDMIVEAMCRSLIETVEERVTSKLEAQLGYTPPKVFILAGIVHTMEQLKATMYDMLGTSEFTKVVGEFVNLASVTIKYVQHKVVPQISQEDFELTPAGKALLRDYEQQSFEGETCH